MLKTKAHLRNFPIFLSPSFYFLDPLRGCRMGIHRGRVNPRRINGSLAVYGIARLLIEVQQRLGALSCRKVRYKAHIAAYPQEMPLVYGLTHVPVGTPDSALKVFFIAQQAVGHQEPIK